MDPNETLRALRAYAAKVLQDNDDPDNGVDQDEARAFAEAFEHLDQWISRGGFLPESWARRGGS